MANKLEFTKELALKAGKILKDFFGQDCERHYKEGHELVTEADIASEKLIIKEIKKIYPSHNIWSEESGYEKKNSEYTWIIDPLDGTVNFSTKIPLFSVSIGLWKDEKPYLGVIYYPMTDQLSWAKLGAGAFLNGKKLSVCKKELKDSTIMLDSNLLQLDTLQTELRALIKQAHKARAIGVATSNMLTVANGGSPICIDRCNKPGDFAAAAIIVQEAGGKITDFEGNDLTIKDDDVIATNGEFHDMILKAIK